MYIVDIINKKRCNKELTKEEIEFVVKGYMEDTIKDYQMSSLLMAICINGLNEKEVFNLTDAMIKSGDILDLSSINGIKVDKHSTGGIGDKTTLVIAPIVASLGVPVAKMSGRGLGYTGGTIDKLESIKGFNVNLSINDIIKEVNDISISLSTNSGTIAPIDKKIYSLRDVTGTVSSKALIASSIMSKKLAMGTDKILLDVKYGKGALLEKVDDAIELAKLMVSIGNNYGKETIAIISNMNYPLGNMIGNSLEVKEAMEVLNNRGNKDLLELCMVLSSYMVSMAKGIDFNQALKEVQEVLNNKKAYNKFIEMVEYQGGDINSITVSNNVVEIKSDKNGYINDINALMLGETSMRLGSGRINKEDTIRYDVGIEIVKNIGQYVNIGDVIAKLYIGDKNNYEDVLKAFTIEDVKKEKEKLIYGVVK